MRTTSSAAAPVRTPPTPTHSLLSRGPAPPPVTALRAAAGRLAAARRAYIGGAGPRAAAMAPAAGADAAAARAAPPQTQTRPAAAAGAPWRVTSEHLDPDLPQTKQLHLVVLNWHLPVLTARLWGQGGRRAAVGR
jgi:hypothetical protein